MDINPKDFTALWEDMEMARKAKLLQSPLIILICAWLDADINHSESGNETVQYWHSRLNVSHKCHFIACNRIGSEEDTTFVGSSTVMSLPSGTILATASKNQSEIIVTEFDL